MNISKLPRTSAPTQKLMWEQVGGWRGLIEAGGWVSRWIGGNGGGVGLKPLAGNVWYGIL